MPCKPVREWKGWGDAPHMMKRHEIMALFRLNDRQLKAVLDEGLLKPAKAYHSAKFKYPLAEVQRYAREQRMDPFLS